MTTARKTIRDIVASKGKTPLVCLTSYTAPFAKIVDQYSDIILVGDSLGMVLYGMENTLGVTLDMMIAHCKAVTKSSERALVVLDMPFGTYQNTREEAFTNAARALSETGCSAVKLEGGIEMSNTIKHLTERGIAVMGHVGIKPQSVNSQGGYYTHGKTQESYKKIIEDAKAVEESGAFSIVLEGVTSDLAHEITDILPIPTIGIGASVSCDGQVLVTEDMAGLLESTPSFVKVYGNMREDLDRAVKQFSSDVHERRFPESIEFLKQKECS